MLNFNLVGARSGNPGEMAYPPGARVAIFGTSDASLHGRAGTVLASPAPEGRVPILLDGASRTVAAAATRVRSLPPDLAGCSPSELLMRMGGPGDAR